jgi:SET domain-containing protein
MKTTAQLKWHSENIANREETILGSDIVWRKISDEKGRGVFAMRDIRKGTVIEISPVVTVAKENVVENGCAPDGYLLQWDEDTPGEEFAMPLGYVMLYNHNSEPTIEIESDLNEYTMTVKAARDLKAGEELTWNYACDLWFESA